MLPLLAVHDAGRAFGLMRPDRKAVGLMLQPEHMADLMVHLRHVWTTVCLPSIHDVFKETTSGIFWKQNIE